MTCARVEDKVDSSLCQTDSRTFGSLPGVFAYFKSKLDTINSINKVANGNLLAIADNFRDCIWRPSLKPTRLVVNAVVSKILFECNTEYFFVADYTCPVVGSMVYTYRQANGIVSLHEF
jgi:hypothetical protein